MMKAYENILPTGLLSAAQKQTVLAQLLILEQQNSVAILNLIISDISKENGADYPGKLGEMISRLGAPYSCLESNSQELNAHKNNVQQFIQKHSADVLILFRIACQSPEGWSSNKIRAIAQHLQIPIPEIMRVRFTIYKGKIYWELCFGLQRRSKYTLPDGVYIEMSWEDFKVFKDAGKRNPRNPLKQNNYEIFYAAASGQQVTLRPNRNPGNAKNLTHNTPGTCHICVYDVDTHSAQGLHMKSKGSHSLKRNPCPHCGEDFDFNRDHIPANSLLTKLNERFTRQGLTKKISRDEGIVIAVPTHLHAFISASYKHKAKTRDALEADHPSAAIYKDVNSYLRFFWESPTEQFDFKKIGALRYLYRRNTKVLEEFSSPHTDHLFVRSLKRALKRKDVGRKVVLLAPSSRWGQQSFFGNNHQRPSFFKLDDGVKNDITLAVMLRDIQELERFYREPNYISFIIKLLARENHLADWDNFHELMRIGSQAGAQPLIFEILKRALEEDDSICQQILLGIVEQSKTTLDEYFNDGINGISLFDVCVLYYSSSDLNEFLETIFSLDSFEEFWTHQDNAGMTPVMKAIRSDNSEVLKFTMKDRVKNLKVFERETTDVTFYDVLNCFYQNYADPLEGVDTADKGGNTVLSHALRGNIEDCVKVILAAHPDLSGLVLAERTSQPIRKLISTAMRIKEIIDTKGGEEDEDLIEMLIVHDEGDLAMEFFASEGALASVGEEKLSKVFGEMLPFFVTNTSTDEVFKVLGFIDEDCIKTFRNTDRETLIHYAVRKDQPAKIALCAAVINFSPEDDFSFDQIADDFQDLLNEFHDEAIFVSTHRPLSPASVISYRMEYEGSLQEFLSQTNSKNQSPLALACELGKIETIKVLLACGAKLERCVYDEKNPELRMMARAIDIIDSEEPDIISLIDVIDSENTETVFLFFEILQDINQNWQSQYSNPLHEIFRVPHFLALDKDIDSDDDETDEERMDFAESMQTFMVKLSEAQKNTLLSHLRKIRPLQDLLIKLINGSERRRESCAELLRLLQNHQQDAPPNEIPELNAQMQNMQLNF